MRKLSAAAVVIAIGWCAVVLLLHDALGTRLLGSTWPQAEPLLAPLVLWMVALAASVGPVQGMLALGAARRSLFTQLAGLVVDLLWITGGAVLAGALGAALAAGMAAVFRTALARIQFSRALYEPVASLSLEARDHVVAEATAL
jgi:hypothetical protein